MSSEQKSNAEPDPGSSRSAYESALFGESSGKLDFDSELTEYGFDESTIVSGARVADMRAEPPRAPRVSTTAPTPSPSRLSANQVFAEHRLTRHVASGRIAEVWLAFDPELQVRRAIKILRPEIVNQPRAVEAFFRAVRAQSQIKHNNIVQVLRVGRQEGVPYYIAEWVEGGTLANLLAHEGSIPVAVAWDIMRQVLLALSHAYGEGLLHRNLCPENILVEALPEKSGEGRRLHVRVMNFGQVDVLQAGRDSQTGQVAAAAHGVRSEYVAPELVTGLPIGFQADIYAAGILLYHMLAGFPPFRANTRGEVLFKQVHDPMPVLPPMVREGLGPEGRAILRRMTEKLPPQRFPTYKELLEATFAAPVVVDRRRSDREQAGEYLEPVLPPKGARPRPVPARAATGGKSKLLPVAAALTLCAIAAAGYLYWQSTQPKPESEADQPATKSMAVAAPIVTPTPTAAAAAPVAQLPAAAVATAIPTAASAAKPSQVLDPVAAMPAMPPIVGTPSDTSDIVAPQFVDGELILDDATPGALNLEPASSWSVSTEPGSYKGSSYIALADGTLKTATFNTDIPETAEYDVYVWWVPGDATQRSNKTICTIYTSSGPFRGTLDQTGSNGSAAFFPIGHYTLNAGKNVRVVSISTEGIPANSASVSVDAIKLVSTNKAAAAQPVTDSSETAVAPATGTGTDDRLIIEAGNGGMNSSHYREIAGRWMDSRSPAHAAKSSASGLTPQGKSGTRKSIFTSVANTAAESAAIARFYPKFTSPGHYHVYTTWPHGGNATPVYYTVQHSQGQAIRTLAQDGYGLPAAAGLADSWIYLGEFDFDSGDEQYVELRVDVGARPSQSKVPGQIYADAVCFSAEPLRDGKRVADIKPLPPSSEPDSTPAITEQAETPTQDTGQNGIVGPLSGKPL